MRKPLSTDFALGTGTVQPVGHRRREWPDQQSLVLRLGPANLPVTTSASTAHRGATETVTPPPTLTASPIAPSSVPTPIMPMPPKTSSPLSGRSGRQAAATPQRRAGPQAASLVAPLQMEERWHLLQECSQTQPQTCPRDQDQWQECRNKPDDIQHDHVNAPASAPMFGTIPKAEGTVANRSVRNQLEYSGTLLAKRRENKHRVPR